MKQKKYVRILALVLVLVMCIGIFTACKKNPDDTPGGNDKPGGDTPGGGTVVTDDSMTSFVKTMFRSANEIGAGTTVNLEKGNDISFNIGFTVKVIKDTETLPVEVYVKGFLDRTNVEETYGENANGAYTKVGENYVLYDPAVHVDTEEQTFVRYSHYYKLKDNNDTRIDIAVRAQNVDSLRLYYTKGKVYATIAGNNLLIDLGQFADFKDGQSLEDFVYNKIEWLLEQDIVKSIAGAFDGKDFDLNKVVSGFINQILGKTVEYIPVADAKYTAGRQKYSLQGGTYVKDDNGTYFVKTLADDVMGMAPVSIAGMINLDGKMIAETIFGSVDTMYKCLGETINLEEILKAIGPKLFDAPNWEKKVANGWKSVDFDKTGDKAALMQGECRATITLGGGLKDLLASFAPSLNGAIQLGFEKKAGSGDNAGRMDAFFVRLNFNNVEEAGGKLGVEFRITDLGLGNAKDDFATTIDTDNYGAFNFDAGMDLDISKNLMELLFRNASSADNQIAVKFGGDDFSFDAATNTFTLPEKLSLNIKGTLDLENFLNTKALATLKAGDNTIATLQLYAEGDDLVADVKVDDAYKGLIENILDVCAAIGNGTIGVNGFRKNGEGNWGFYNDDGTVRTHNLTNGVYSYESINNVLDNFVKTGEMRVEGLNVINLINAFISGDKRIYVNFNKAPAAAEIENGRYSADFLLTTIMGDGTHGLLAALHKIVSFGEDYVAISGVNALSSIMTTIFEYKAADDVVLSPSVIIGSLMHMAADGFQFMGYNNYDAAEDYMRFEEQAVILMSRGIVLNDKTGNRLLPDTEITAVRGQDRLSPAQEKFQAYINAGDDATRTKLEAELKEYGYAVVTCTDGTKAMYPYVLWNKFSSDETAALANGFVKDGNELKAKTVDTLKAELIAKLNGEGANKDNFVSVGKAELTQLLRLGKAIMPVVDAEGVWTIAYEYDPLFDESYLKELGAKVRVYTEKDGGRITRGSVKLETWLIGGESVLECYMNFLTSAPEININNNLVSEATKTNALKISAVDVSEL